MFDAIRAFFSVILAIFMLAGPGSCGFAILCVFGFIFVGLFVKRQISK